MDTLTQMSLFSGVGCTELGLKLILPVRTVCYVENDAYCQRVLEARIRDGCLDDAPIWDDITTFDGRPWRGLVDIVSGGFPCQPFSSASRGRQRAKTLWPAMRSVIGTVCPSLVCIENVQGSAEALLRGADDLRGLGYEVPPLLNLRAAAVGAPHLRARFFMVGYLNSNGKPIGPLNDEMANVPESALGMETPWSAKPVHLVRMDDGAANRVDRRQCSGNGIVPQQLAAAVIELFDAMES